MSVVLYCQYAKCKAKFFHPHLPQRDFISSLLKEMIDFADKNGEGEVNKKEFLKMMKYD